MSRCKVFVLKALTGDDIMKLLDKAMSSPEGFGDRNIDMERNLMERIAAFSDGELRFQLLRWSFLTEMLMKKAPSM